MARCKPVPHRIMTTNSVMGRVRLPLAAHSLCLCEFCVESITVAGRGSRYSLSLMLLLSTNSDSTSRNRAHDRSGMVTAVRKLLRTCHRKKKYTLHYAVQYTIKDSSRMHTCATLQAFTTSIFEVCYFVFCTVGCPYQNIFPTPLQAR